MRESRLDLEVSMKKLRLLTVFYSVLNYYVQSSWWLTGSACEPVGSIMDNNFLYFKVA